MEFPGVRALDNVDLVLHKGEIHAIVGENGAGKSTLIKVLAGAYRPTAGRIKIDGSEVRFTGPRHGLASGIGVVYQERALVPSLTAVDNILLGQEPARFGVLDQKAMKARAREALDMIGASVNMDVPVAELSAGDQQLVEIAKIALMGPKIMVLDEPTAALSDTEIESLFSCCVASGAEHGHPLYIAPLERNIRTGRHRDRAPAEGCRSRPHTNFTTADASG